MKYYRPISLSNVSYKIVAKVISIRLKSIIHHVIGPKQLGFLVGRSSVNNIIVIQDVVHSWDGIPITILR